MNWQLILSNGLVTGGIMSVALSVLIIASLRLNAAMWVGDYPPDVQAAYGDIDDRTQRGKTITGVVFMAIMIGLAVWNVARLAALSGGQAGFWAVAASLFVMFMTFNLVDMVILDWLFFVTFRPGWIVLPGTEGLAGYRDYGFHAVASLKGVGIGLVGSLVLAGISVGVLAVV